MAAAWYQLQNGGESLVLTLHIQPGAKRTEVCGLHGDALKIRVAAPASDHQANDLLLEFLGKSFRVNRKQIIVKHGEHARRKTVVIDSPGCRPEVLLETT